MTESVLVFEAQAIGMIGVIRSLGRAGYRVHAASARADAPGLYSRYAAVPVVHPPYHEPAFLTWLSQYVPQHGIAAIVPSEAFLLAIEPVYEQYRALLPDAPERNTLYRCFAKTDVQAHFDRVADPVLVAQQPRALVVKRGAPLPGADTFADWQWPLYVKTDGLHADRDHAADVKAARDPLALHQRLAAALATHDRCLIQETVPGVKATVNLWRHRGEFHAESMCVAMHENPHTGGLTAYRQVWWQPQLLADAKARLRTLDWQGVAMVEYKWDAANGRFWFLELNARYWNALNLDLLAGKDFPRWQLDAFFGKATVQDSGPGPLGFRARYTVPADLGYALSRIRDRNIAFGQKLWTALEFFLLELNPSVASDLWFAGDRRLYWRAWWDFLRKLGRPA